MAEEIGQGGGRKIRTVLVIDVPERRFAENPSDVRNLEENHRAAFCRRQATYRVHETAGLADVLERHLAADKVRCRFSRRLGEEFADKADLLGVSVEPRGNEAGVVADAAIASELTNQRQELAFPATDLEHILFMELMTLDQLLGKAPMEGVESRREALCFLVLLRIDRPIGLPQCVEDETARLAKRQGDIARLEIERLLAIGNQQTAVRGNTMDGVEADAAF